MHRIAWVSTAANVLPLFLGWLEAWELLVGVRDVQAAIHCTLQGTPHAVAGGLGTRAETTTGGKAFGGSLFLITVAPDSK